MKSTKKSVVEKCWCGSKYSSNQYFIAPSFSTLQCHFLMFVVCLCDRKGMVQVMCWLQCRERNAINYVERMMTSHLLPGCRTRICSKVKHCMVHCANYTLNEYLIPDDHWAWCFATQHIWSQRGFGIIKYLHLFGIWFSVLQNCVIRQNQYCIWHGISWSWRSETSQPGSTNRTKGLA